MLVLSRRTNDSILIGEGVRIHVLEISGQTIRLGIEAPREVTILRGELVQSARAGDSKPLESLHSECCVC